MSAGDLLDRLDAASHSAVPSVLLVREAAAEIRRLRRRVKEAEDDNAETSRSASAEAMWRERQGEDYGSF